MTTDRRSAALAALFLASVAALSLTRIADTDAWMHLSLGKMVWQHGSASFPEPYLYPSMEKVYHYFSWLFGLSYYLAFLAGGAAGVVLLKAATVLAIFYVMLKDSLRPYGNHVVSVAVLTVAVLMVKHRFVERPDTWLMFFIAFGIFSLNAYVYDNKKYLYALPLMHAVWSCSHTSMSLMVVPFAAFIAGGFLQRLAAGRGMSCDAAPTMRQLRTVGIVFLLSAAAALITPYATGQSGGFGQFTAGPGIVAGSSWTRMNILEMNPPRWPFNKWPFIMPVAVLLSFILNRRRISFFHLFLVIPYLVLPLMAKRFIFLLGVAAAPVIARNLSAFLDTPALRSWSARRLPAAAAAAWIVLYTGLSLGQVGPFADRSNRFGFGFSTAAVPEGALRYMDRRDIQGRMFNLLDWGGYINWRDYPRRSVFIDPRADLPADLGPGSDMDAALQKPSLLDFLEGRYGFDALLLRYPLLARSSLLVNSYADSDVLVAHAGWRLVYWDDLSLLYLREGGRYDHVVREDAYRFIRPANFSTFARARLHETDYREGSERELLRNARETGSSRAAAMLGMFYNETGRWKDALSAYARAADSPDVDRLAVFTGMGDAAAGLGDHDAAAAHYRRALGLKKDDATILYKIGLAYDRKGDKSSAAAFMERALRANADLTSLYSVLPRVYGELGMQKEAAAVARSGAAPRAASEQFTYGSAAYRAGRFDVAFTAFEQAARMSPANPLCYSSLGFAAYELGLLGKAFEYHKMAMDLDPLHADAFHGTALILKKWGDAAAARRYWSDYLRIAPSGRFAELARQEGAVPDAGR